MIGYSVRTKIVTNLCSLEYEDTSKYFKTDVNFVESVYSKILTNDLTELCVVAYVQICTNSTDMCITNRIYSRPVWYKCVEEKPEWDTYEQAFDISLDELWNMLVHLNISDPGDLITQAHIMPEYKM